MDFDFDLAKVLSQLGAQVTGERIYILKGSKLHSMGRNPHNARSIGMLASVLDKMGEASAKVSS